MIDCISRDSVCLNKHVFYHPKDGIARNNGYDPADWAIRISDVMDVPTADVVARDAFNRILAENDTMREQLAQIGKKPGDKMEDVRPVVRGKWEIDNSYAGPGLMNLRCSVCGEFGGTWRDCTLPSMLYKFCPNCGADMREPNLDATKGLDD